MQWARFVCAVARRQPCDRVVRKDPRRVCGLKGRQRLCGRSVYMSRCYDNLQGEGAPAPALGFHGALNTTAA